MSSLIAEERFPPYESHKHSRTQKDTHTQTREHSHCCNELLASQPKTLAPAPDGMIQVSITLRHGIDLSMGHLIQTHTESNAAPQILSLATLEIWDNILQRIVRVHRPSIY